ncbi:MAG: hypothetical protein RR209_00700 [Angelakisella sp.]
MATIKIKRGLQAGVTKLVLAEGEMAVALDTGNVYIGTSAGTVHINPTGGTADDAVKLKNTREFSVTGDAVAAAIGFNGTQNVALQVALATMAGLTAGTYTKVTVDGKGRVTAGTTLTVEDLPAIPASKVTGMPTKVSDLNNDASYQTAAQVSAAVAALVASSPATLDTLKELAAALGNDPNFATTVAGQIGQKVDKVAGKGLSEADFTGAEKTKLSGLSNYVHPTAGAKASGLYKITVDGLGHVTAATAVTKADITGLGIPGQDTIYTLPTAAAGVKGGVKVGAGLVMTGEMLSVGDVDGGTF